MATRSDRPTALSNQHVGRLKSEFDSLRLDEVLDLDDGFTAREIGRDQYETKKLLRILRNSGAIEVIGDVTVVDQGGCGTSWVNEYRWRREVVDYLETYKDERSELPCGCRAHIYHNDNGTLGCRHCDDDPEFGREEVKEAMSE